MLSRINRTCGADEAVDLDVETAFLLVYAGRARDLSDGAFDVTSGILRHVWRDGADMMSAEADLGGLVKEYDADRAAEAAGMPEPHQAS